MWETRVLSLGWEDPLEKGKAGYPLQYSDLENSMDCNGVAKSRLRLSDLHFFFFTFIFSTSLYFSSNPPNNFYSVGAISHESGIQGNSVIN